MGLSDNRVNPQVAVSDRAEAEAFYEGSLGLAKGEGSREASWRYPCGDGSVLYVFLAPGHAGTATGTVARFDVDDIERAVDELSAKGVRFERYEEPVRTDEKGIHDSGYGKVAWFKDPDGNTYALEQV
jgi:catechol 2,3-dioxygenase-like lactoylglutathione lyase family enzyme